MRFGLFILVSTFTSAAVVGCGQSASTDVPAHQLTQVSVDGSKYLLIDEPEGAIGVIAARETANDGEPIVVVGRIGGSANPWIEGRAAFMLLDASMLLVANGTESAAEGEVCLDDCCAAERAECTTLVKLVDADGKVLAADARQLFGVAADDMVVVRGKANKDESGNFVVLADGIHVRR